MASNVQTQATLCDRIQAAAILLSSIPHLESLRSQHARVLQHLEQCLKLAHLTRERTGQPPRVDDALGWLSRVVARHPAFERPTPDGQHLQGELQALIARIAHGR
jgi:hypothetical protein